jgi:hypothetical protein
MKQWLIADAEDADAIHSVFDQVPGVQVKDQIRLADGVLGLVVADTSQFPLSRLDETIATPSIRGISVYRDEQRARKVAQRLVAD